MSAVERLTFDDLEPYLLLKNGNFLYKIPFRGGHAVLKVYFGSRGALGRVYKSIANVLLYGQTSYLAYTRRRIERECLALWSECGFRTFEVYEDVEIEAPNCPPGGWLLLEFVDEIKINAFMADLERAEDERFVTWRRFLGEWGRRHALAIERREPRLVHENGDGKHVMVLPDGEFLWFDFEMIYRSRKSVRWQVAHEVMQYMWEILRHCGPDMEERLLRETVAHYPERQRLADACDLFLRPPGWFMRVARRLDRKRARAKKPSSKYNVARKLRAALAAGSGGEA